MAGLLGEVAGELAALVVAQLDGSTVLRVVHHDPHDSLVRRERRLLLRLEPELQAVARGGDVPPGESLLVLRGARAFVRREVIHDKIPEVSVPETQSPALERSQALARLDQILAGLDEDKRAVFVLFELEQMPMQEVAVAIGCPLQTAYTRLHAARQQVNAAIERLRKRGAR